ncbi:unnamed protein product [Rotaria sordida]|uniref:Uncharacterized protein n=1 Tax=Rotaria sordida TaxID=392033 RepID=A0A815P0Y5_9BILA|nr:unnamed protein product [Rotaria sordida]
MLRITNQIKSSLEYVPLKQINIESTIRSFAANVTITQIFRNDEYTSIEAVYYFPIEEQAAIYNFTARIDNREIIAQLKEKKEAQFENNNVLKQQQQQHCTYLLEQDEKSQDTFIINVGSLPPSKECIIIISYVTELDLIQGSIIRFVIPTTIAPRYSSKKKRTISLVNTKSKYYVQSIPYIIEFQCRIEKIYGPNQQQYIARLNSPSHHVDIDLSLHDAYIVTFAQKNTYLDRYILLDIKLSDKRANTFVVVESNAAMAAVTPFEEDCYLTLNNRQTNEFIFILDCSGSMKNENKIGLAREAMLYFIRNLPMNCYFNIIKFGAKYSCLFNESTASYNNINIRIAEKFISQIRADLGGTEILAPLQWLERHPPPIDRSRQVFLLTDGEVSNVSEVLELCRSMASSTRIFSFGLGASPSRSLVKGLARTTNGRFIFIPPNTHIDVYVREQLQKAIQRCITNIHIQWNLGIPIQNVPNQLSPAYMNDRLIIYALTNNQTIQLNNKSSIEIRTNQSYYRLGITNTDRITNNTKMIARLAAKALILELEHCKILRKNSKQVRFADIDDDSKKHNEIIRTKENIKQRIIDLSLQYNILSRYTIFIGIEKYFNNNSTDIILREVPIQISTDNQYFQSIDSRSEKILSDINDIDSYSSSLTKISTLMNDKDMSYYQEKDSLEHVQSHRNISIPVHSSTSKESRYITLSNEHKFIQDNLLKKDIYRDQNEICSMNDKDLVYYLINKQKDDGLWNFDTNRKTIKDLTGKPLAIFQSLEIHGNIQIFVTAIIIVLFEVRFMALRSIWDDAVEKARQRLINLLNNDWKQLIFLFRHIRLILSG